MRKSTMYRTALMIALALGASGCSVLKRKTPKTPVLGERIAVLSSEGEVTVDPALREIPMNLPPAVANTEWAQSGGNASKSVGHLALGCALGQAWQASIGRGSSVTMRLASAPIVAGGKVFTIDAAGLVHAYDAQTGGQVWAIQTPYDKGGENSIYGGGLAYDNGYVFATNGNGYVVALNAINGGQRWKVRPGGPLRGAPSASSGAVYAMSQDNQIYALDQASGKTNWSQTAALEIAGVFGSASPAVGQGTVVAGFSSGELNAYRYENGRQVWQDALQRTSVTTSVSSLSDIDADPVIDSGQVYAIGQGGRMVALELSTGQRLWEANISGISTPWVAGDWVFVVTSDAKLICFARSTGNVRLINSLPAFVRPKNKRGQIDYSGPVLAGDRLVITSSTGAIINMNPINGSFQSQTNVGAEISLPPVVANSTLYVLDDKGVLHAFR